VNVCVLDLHINHNNLRGTAEPQTEIIVFLDNLLLKNDVYVEYSFVIVIFNPIALNNLLCFVVVYCTQQFEIKSAFQRLGFVET
jgi:hypothetical protein